MALDRTLRDESPNRGPSSNDAPEGVRCAPSGVFRFASFCPHALWFVRLNHTLASAKKPALDLNRQTTSPLSTLLVDRATRVPRSLGAARWITRTNRLHRQAP